jgi:hypothetical protein
MNEILWKIVDEIELDGKSYWECYRALAVRLNEKIDRFEHPLHWKFMRMQTRKMESWLEIIDKLE